MRRLAIVVQRFGEEITGGAELHSRWVAGKLKDRFDITIFTTTALDYTTWEEHYPAGESRHDGCRLVRFPVARRRDFELFNSYSRWVFHERHRDVDEERWLEMQGPYAPELIEALSAERTRFDAFLFFTYLYYTTARGLPRIPDRAVLLPTAHDEPALTLRLYENVFRQPKGFLLNTDAERRLLERRFGLGRRPRSVVGMGVDLPASVNPPATVERFGLRPPYALTFGRICYGKGHDVVFRCYPADRSELDLVVFGQTEMEIPDSPKVRYLGRISDQERWDLIAGAAFTIHPSLYESLSLALLESWAMGVPALVNGECLVLKEHVIKCGAGLWYQGDVDFDERFLCLCRMPHERRVEMGEAGRRYVMQNYEAERVADRYAWFLNRMIDLGF